MTITMLIFLLVLVDALIFYGFSLLKREFDWRCKAETEYYKTREKDGDKNIRHRVKVSLKHKRNKDHLKLIK